MNISALTTGSLLLALLGPAEAKRESIPPILRPVFELDAGRVELFFDRDAPELAASAVLHHPTLRVSRRLAKEPQSSRPEPPGLGEVVREALPFSLAIDHLAIHDATIVYVDESVPGRTELRIHDLEMSVENFSTRHATSRGLPTMVSARGRIGEQGTLAAFVTINPRTGELDFAGRAQVVDLRVEEIAGLIEERTSVRPADGTFTTFIEFSVHQGQVWAGVKPILWDLDLAPEDVDALAELESWFTDPLVELVAEPAIAILDNEVRGRDALATLVPLRGTVRAPEPDLTEAILGVLENAFIESVTVGFGRVPPGG